MIFSQKLINIHEHTDLLLLISTSIVLTDRILALKRKQRGKEGCRVHALLAKPLVHYYNFNGKVMVVRRSVETGTMYMLCISPYLV